MRAIALALAVAAGLTVAPAAFAKENVVATLYDPESLLAPPGTEVAVTFSLRAQLQDGSEARFSATGLFVRVRAASSGRSLEVGAEELAVGSFVARFRMPRGGIDDLVVGLPGLSSGPSGTRRTDLLFLIVDDPFPPAEPGSSYGTRTLVPVLALLAPLCVLGLGIARRSGRRADARGDCGAAGVAAPRSG
jgi:hypothetical protein